MKNRHINEKILILKEEKQSEITRIVIVELDGDVGGRFVMAHEHASHGSGLREPEQTGRS